MKKEYKIFAAILVLFVILVLNGCMNETEYTSKETEETAVTAPVHEEINIPLSVDQVKERLERALASYESKNPGDVLPPQERTFFPEGLAKSDSWVIISQWMEIQILQDDSKGEAVIELTGGVKEPAQWFKENILNDPELSVDVICERSSLNLAAEDEQVQHFLSNLKKWRQQYPGCVEFSSLNGWLIQRPFEKGSDTISIFAVTPEGDKLNVFLDVYSEEKKDWLEETILQGLQVTYTYTFEDVPEILGNKELSKSMIMKERQDVIQMECEKQKCLASQAFIPFYIKSASPMDFDLGDCQRLEVQLDGKWYIVPERYHSAFPRHSVGYFVPSGETLKGMINLGWFAALRPGNYRYVQSVTESSGHFQNSNSYAKTYYLTAEFTLE